VSDVDELQNLCLLLRYVATLRSRQPTAPAPSYPSCLKDSALSQHRRVPAEPKPLKWTHGAATSARSPSVSPRSWPSCVPRPRHADCRSSTSPGGCSFVVQSRTHGETLDSPATIGAWHVVHRHRSQPRPRQTSRRLTSARMTKSLAVGFLTTTGGFTLKARSPRVRKKSPSSGLLDDVRESLAACRHGPARWYERVAPEHRAELAALKAAWLAGELGTRKKTLARTISARLRDRGISDVGEQGVISWLDAA
jgi:hypothetical protein